MMKNYLKIANSTAIKKVLLILMAIFFSLILLEFGLRYSGYLIGNFREYKNSQKLKSKGSYRIMCVGESTTANQYPKFLEAELSRRYKTGSFKVIDKGLPGGNTNDICSEIEFNIEKYEPDMIIAMMGINDAKNMLPWYKEDRRDITIFSKLKIYRVYLLLKKEVIEKLNIYLTGGMENTNTQSVVSNTFFYLGKQYTKNKEYAKALKMFYKAIKNNKYSIFSYIEIGDIYAKQMNYDKAIEIFHTAVKLAPDNLLPWSKLGFTCADHGKYAEFEQICQEFIKVPKVSFVVYTVMGNVNFFTNRDMKAAEAMYIKAKNANPNLFTYSNLINCYRKLGKLKDIDNIIKEMPQNNESDGYYGLLAMHYLETSNYEMADVYFNKAEEIRMMKYNKTTYENYRYFAKLVIAKNIKLLCMQYPTRSITPLKKMLQGIDGIVFVDNEKIFKEVLKKSNYNDYFRDQNDGDFGHCTDKGDEMIAANITEVIAKEVFKR